MTGGQLHDWRRRHGFTQAEAATRLGISRRALQRYEHNARPMPRAVALATRAVTAGLDGDRAAPPRLLPR